jgi:S-adenosylmethionine:tRNA ribosyltransferase-isomerase
LIIFHINFYTLIMMLSINDYDYTLPAELIAQEPLAERDQARMLVLDRVAGSRAHRRFSYLPEWLSDRDVLVVNNTRVFPARLRGHKDSGGRVEALLLAPPKLSETGELPHRAKVKALFRSSKPPKVGQKLFFGSELTGTITTVTASGHINLQLESPERNLGQVLAEVGDMPLPPYIRRPAGAEDAQRYQTVYASQTGAVAAPTAGLHFTPAVFQELEAKGVEIIYLTLHVGPGTFQPVREEDYSRHRLAAEFFFLSPESAKAINRARTAGKNIVAVGTTSVRVLEFQFQNGQVQPGAGACGLFIYPGYRFQIVDRLITNFHLPKSTLLLLVSAFAGRDLVLQAYQEAIAERYRFYSYGDCMLIL